MFDITHSVDIEAKELIFEVEMPRGAWFGLGFGTTMAETDMIGWFAHSKKTPKAYDLWSPSSSGYGYDAPLKDQS